MIGLDFAPKNFFGFRKIIFLFLRNLLDWCLLFVFVDYLNFQLSGIRRGQLRLAEVGRRPIGGAFFELNFLSFFTSDQCFEVGAKLLSSHLDSLTNSYLSPL